jgi:hypothetical protein
MKAIHICVEANFAIFGAMISTFVTPATKPAGSDEDKCAYDMAVPRDTRYQFPHRTSLRRELVSLFSSKWQTRRPKRFEESILIVEPFLRLVRRVKALYKYKPLMLQ